MPTAFEFEVRPLEASPHCKATMAMTGRMKRKGRMIMARVNRAQEIRAELGLTAEADMDLDGVGTSHSGVIRDRPSNMSMKVIPRPTSLV